MSWAGAFQRILTIIWTGEPRQTAITMDSKAVALHALQKDWLKRPVRLIAIAVISFLVGAGAGWLVSLSPFGWAVPFAELRVGLLTAAASLHWLGRGQLIRGAFTLGLATCLAALASLAWFGLTTFSGESVCVWDPLADTYLASPDVRLKLSNVHVGMYESEVIAIAGEPLERNGNRWTYSRDGKCSDVCDRSGDCHCDWAWLFLAVTFSDGVVDRVTSQWSFD